jgi:uncharacterized membrane protein YagU involved in acid resistance
VDWAGWATFGLGSTVALTSIMILAQVVGLSRMDIPMMLGTMFFEDLDRARVVGFLVHLINGQLFGLLYAGAFAALDLATWWLGAIFGLFHGVVALLVLVPLLPGIHRRMASERGGPDLNAVLEPPGLLALNYGRETPLITLAAHVVYGASLGGFLTPG